DVQGRFKLSYHEIGQRFEMHVEMFGVVLGIHLRESVGDDREVRLRFANGNPALQVTQHEPIFWEPAAELSFRAAGLFGEPQVRIAPGEARRHDADQRARRAVQDERDRKSTRLNSSHQIISYAVFCLKKKKKNEK